MSRNTPVKGAADIMAFLTALGPRIENQAIRAGLRAAAGVIRDEARLRAPKDTGMLAKAIGTSSAKRNMDGSYSVQVRVRGPKEPGGNRHAFLGLFHEYGVKPHIITSGDSNLSARKLTQKIGREGGSSDVATGALKVGDKFVTGSVMHPGHAAQPFMRPALDAKAEDAVEAFRQRIIAVVEGKTGFNMAADLDEAA